MCGSMVDIQSATAENRGGKKRKIEKEETTGQKYNGLPLFHRAAITMLTHELSQEDKLKTRQRKKNTKSN